MPDGSAAPILANEGIAVKLDFLGKRAIVGVPAIGAEMRSETDDA